MFIRLAAVAHCWHHFPYHQIHREPLLPFMETFRQTVNDCTKIGLDNNVSKLKKLSSQDITVIAEFQAF